MSDFLKAAASYYGVPADIISKSEFFAADGQSTFVVEIPVSTEDMLGIADRMKMMRAEAQAQHEQVRKEMEYPVAGRELMRAEYNGMDQVTRGRFGSFAAYMAWRMTEGAKLGKEERALPAYVLLGRDEVTELQRAGSGVDPVSGKYMVQIEDLTPQQLAAHFGVTSNADDFGGMPG
jgi:hypothetical protein